MTINFTASKGKGTGCQLIILPPIVYYDVEKPTSSDINDASLMVTIIDNSKKDNKLQKKYKIVLPGDIQGRAMREITLKDKNGEYVNKTYTNILQDNGYKSLHLKAAHHGKGRWHDFISNNYLEDSMGYIYFRDGYVIGLEKPSVSLENWYLYCIGQYLRTYNYKYEYDAYYFSEYGTYEKDFINLVNPSSIVGSHWTSEAFSAKTNPGLTDEKNSKLTKSQTALDNYYLYQK